MIYKINMLQKNIKQRNLAEWLQYLENLPTGLERNSAPLTDVKKIFDLLDLKNNPAFKITVTGTNGKGSCVAFLENILLAEGISVGAYTSPHLLRYNERIRLNGKEIENKELEEAFSVIYDACQSTNSLLNYFEFSTLAAFLIFKQQNFKVLLLEVGVGGRLDPVNLLDSNISVITTISLDHTAQLGENRELIGREKSGIMRAFKPVICGDFSPPQSVFEYAAEIRANLYCLNKDYFYEEKNDFWNFCCKNIKYNKLPIPNLPLQNAATSLMVIELLKTEIFVAKNAIITGLMRAFLPGRFQKLNFGPESPECIVDVAHNLESASLLAKNLRKTKFVETPYMGVSNKKLRGVKPCTVAVVSILKDKDIKKTFEPLLNIVDFWYVGVLSSKRAASLEQLKEGFLSLNVKNVEFFLSISEALFSAMKECSKNGRIICFGSFYVVSEIFAIQRSILN